LLSGSVFSGMFVNGRRNGHGTFYSAKKGTTYSGSYLDNERHGIGTVTFEDGRSVQGLWQRGKWVRKINSGN
jgi:hypothetical protein